MRQLEIFIDEARVGTLSESDDRWSLEYDAAWRFRGDAYDLAPSLSRAKGVIEDGATNRPVQWFFDNLLPEEALRDAIAASAKIEAADSFGLLEAFGAESAGAITLLRTGAAQPTPALEPLPPEVLSARIAAMPRKPLAADAPKHMSLAGAQHKLAVVLRDGRLFEPVGAAASTHILKPDHLHANRYPHSVANEWFVMTLAARARVPVPPVQLLRVPAPVYAVARFDRYVGDGPVRRLHAIDACQLLGVSRAWKYQQMSPKALADCAVACRTPMAARQQLFRWLVFNLLVGNNDAHLKNVSFLVDAAGSTPAPFYDLLATSLYPFDGDRPAHVDAAELPMAIGGVQRMGEVRAAHLDAAARELGLGTGAGARFRRELIERVPALGAELLALVEKNESCNAGEPRLLRMVVHTVIAEMAQRLA